MSKKRTATRFLKSFGEVLRAKAETDPDLLPVVDAFARALKGQIGKSPGKQGDLPLLDQVAPLLANATADGDEIRDLLEATSQSIEWYRCYPSHGVPDVLANGMIAAHVVGTRGILKSDDLIAGFFLIGPGVDYPLHDHIAEELYYVVSGELTIQNGFEGSPRQVGVGQYSVTPSGVPHRLQTGDEPVLIVFAWTGTVACDVWWWENVEANTWRRVLPPRTAGPTAKAP